MNRIIGIDAGSRTTKIVLLEDERLAFSRVFPTGFDPWERIDKTLSELPDASIMASGYGRRRLKERLGARCVTEIKACAAGARREFPRARLILDVGGQDCKAIFLDENGAVAAFEMNDRCAAGTGKFIEVMALSFQLGLDDFVALAGGADESVVVNSMCAVFAESEVVSLIASGKSRAGIALGLHESIARRLRGMLSRFSADSGSIVFAGGGAKNDCLYNLLMDMTGRSIKRPVEPQLTVALGAALCGMKKED